MQINFDEFMQCLDTLHLLTDFNGTPKHSLPPNIRQNLNNEDYLTLTQKSELIEFTLINGFSSYSHIVDLKFKSLYEILVLTTPRITALELEYIKIYLVKISIVTIYPTPNFPNTYGICMYQRIDLKRLYEYLQDIN
jgi:hypothetical protein